MERWCPSKNLPWISPASTDLYCPVPSNAAAAPQASVGSQWKMRPQAPSSYRSGSACANLDLITQPAPATQAAYRKLLSTACTAARRLIKIGYQACLLSAAYTAGQRVVSCTRLTPLISAAYTAVQCFSSSRNSASFLSAAYTVAHRNGVPSGLRSVLSAAYTAVQATSSRRRSCTFLSAAYTAVQRWNACQKALVDLSAA